MDGVPTGSSIQATIREFEARVRRWRQLRFGFADAAHFLPGRRTASSESRSGSQSAREERGEKELVDKPPTPTRSLLPGVRGLLRERRASAVAAKGLPPVAPSTPPPTLPRPRPRLDLPIGAASSPLPRKQLDRTLDMDRAAHLGITSTPLILPPEDSQSPEALARQRTRSRYDAMKSKANTLRLMGMGELQVSKLSELVHMRTIGTGNFGSVEEMTFQGQIMAVKRIYKGRNTEEESKHLLIETFVAMQDHGCANIVRSYGYLFFEDTFYVCMEKAATCLHRVQYRTKYAPIPEEHLQRITTDVLIGLKCLKDKYRILHRDVKPSNILLSHDGVAKICDFGIAGRLENSRMHSESVGCPPYMAPERFAKAESDSAVLLLHSANYDVRSDVWSLGITQVELARGRHPYGEYRDNEFQMIARMLEMPAPVIKHDEGLSGELVEFSGRCLTKDPHHRYKYDALMGLVYVVRGQLMGYEPIAEWLQEIMMISEDDAALPPPAPPPSDPARMEVGDLRPSCAPPVPQRRSGEGQGPSTAPAAQARTKEIEERRARDGRYAHFGLNEFGELLSEEGDEGHLDVVEFPDRRTHTQERIARAMQERQDRLKEEKMMRTEGKPETSRM